MLKDILNSAAQEFRSKNVSEPEKSAEFLLRQVLGTSSCHSREGGNLAWDKAKLLANLDYKLSDGQEKRFREYIERRKKHEPVWYITGKIEFYGLDLEVNQNVLIPRPETEFLVEEVLSVIPAKAGIQKEVNIDSRLRGNDKEVRGNDKEVRGNDNIKMLELGTGSGAISLAIANELKIKKEKVKIFASDISSEALKVAKRNAKNLGLEKYIEFRHGDLFRSWPQILGTRKGEKFDIVVANLPYIPYEEMSSLAFDIHHWEPRVALDGGKDGLEIYERLLRQAKDYLNKNAIMFFEVGIEQGDKLKKLTKKYLPRAKVEIQKDYGDIDRIAIISA